MNFDSFFINDPVAKVRFLNQNEEHELENWVAREKPRNEDLIDPFAGYPRKKIYMIPVIDQTTQQQMMLSLTETGQRLVKDMLERVQRLEETNRLIRAQQKAARNFKYSRMVYGTR